MEVTLRSRRASGIVRPKYPVGQPKRPGTHSFPSSVGSPKNVEAVRLGTSRFPWQNLWGATDHHGAAGRFQPEWGAPTAGEAEGYRPALPTGEAQAMIEDLRRWARTFRAVQSVDVAELLEDAATSIETGQHDGELAAELIACACARDHRWEQRSATTLMRQAAETLIGTKDGTADNK